MKDEKGLRAEGDGRNRNSKPSQSIENGHLNPRADPPRVAAFHKSHRKARKPSLTRFLEDYSSTNSNGDMDKGTTTSVGTIDAVNIGTQDPSTSDESSYGGSADPI